MRSSEIRRWLEENGGLKNQTEKRVAIKTTEYGKEVTGYETHIVLTANNGRVLEYIPGDPGEQTKGKSQAEVDAMTVDGQLDVDNRVVSRGDPDNADSRSPEKKAEDQSAHAEKIWNKVNGPNPSEEDKRHPAYTGNHEGSGLMETHRERIDREQREKNEREQDEDRARRGRTEERQAANEAERIEISRRAEERQAAADARRAETEARQAETDKERIGLERDRVGLEQRRVEQAEKGQTQVVGSPTYSDKNVTTYNPVTGQTGSFVNPNYDELKVKAEREKERIRLEIEAGKYNAEVGAQKYKEWHDANVATPLALAAERRAQATEQRQAEEAADRREQKKKELEIERARLGQTAAESAQANARAMLPYMAGPEFGEQFSAAINGLAAGGRLGTNAAAGINFTADAFEFNAPNFKRIAKEATKSALKHLTPYDPDDAPYSVADYSGIPLPTAETMQQAPTVTAPQITLPPYEPGVTINSGT